MKKPRFRLKRDQICLHVPRVLEMILFIATSPAHALLTSRALLLQRQYSVGLGSPRSFSLSSQVKVCFILFSVCFGIRFCV